MTVDFPKGHMPIVDVSRSELKSEATLSPNLGTSASNGVRVPNGDKLVLQSAPTLCDSGFAVRTGFCPHNLPAGANELIEASYAGLLNAAVRAMDLDEKAIRAIR